MSATGNSILDRLPEDELARLQPHLAPADLSQGAVVYREDEPLDRLYFPVGHTVVSELATTESGLSVEAMLIGREGTTGVYAFCDDQSAVWRSVVQVGGDALAVPASTLRAEVERLPALRRELEAYALVALRFTAQSVACSRFHPLLARAARWLLHVHDRSGDASLRITHDTLASMLGVHRPSVSLVMADLERNRSVERVARGALRVTSRERLEEQSCGCYQRVRRIERLDPPAGEEDARPARRRRPRA